MKTRMIVVSVVLFILISHVLQHCSRSNYNESQPKPATEKKGRVIRGNYR